MVVPQNYKISIMRLYLLVWELVYPRYKTPLNLRINYLNWSGKNPKKGKTIIIFMSGITFLILMLGIFSIFFFRESYVKRTLFRTHFTWCRLNWIFKERNRSNWRCWYIKNCPMSEKYWAPTQIAFRWRLQIWDNTISKKKGAHLRQTPLSLFFLVLIAYMPDVTGFVEAFMSRIHSYLPSLFFWK